MSSGFSRSLATNATVENFRGEADLAVCASLGFGESVTAARMLAVWNRWKNTGKENWVIRLSQHPLIGVPASSFQAGDDARGGRFQHDFR